MKFGNMIRFGLCLALVALCGTASMVCAAENSSSTATPAQSLEMPVLTGTEWQRLNPDAKIAFIWGVGHVVTVEEHVVQRHPELARPDFPTKLAEGLRGVPMNTIVDTIDRYYRTHPDKVSEPVMRVIWRQLVKPKLKTGIADRPINPEPEGE